ncbi:YdcF family protein [Paenibacillus sp. KN14-4R]|uniref:YdcF family protein n=1 Tax=Paenibacillus sp. KN14-4R TaxID=3445773 RepID=UPI003F9EEE7A
MKRISQNNKTRNLLLLCGLLVMVALAWVGYVQWKIQSAPYGKTPDHADVGIVLGAALWKDVPSPGLAERLDHAADLYTKGVFSQIIVSGGMDAGGMITEAEGMKRYLINKQVPESNISLEDRSTSTYENLLFSKQIMNEHNWQSAVIVTHHYHGARALDIANFLGLPNTYLSTTDSKVLYMPWHQARETLAFTKWKLESWFL